MDKNFELREMKKLIKILEIISVNGYKIKIVDYDKERNLYDEKFIEVYLNNKYQFNFNTNTINSFKLMREQLLDFTYNEGNNELIEKQKDLFNQLNVKGLI